MNKTMDQNKPVHKFRLKDFIPFYGLSKYVDRCAKSDAIDIFTQRTSELYEAITNGTEFKPKPYQTKGIGRMLSLATYNILLLNGTMIGIIKGIEALSK
jgi:hypothetical protein